MPRIEEIDKNFDTIEADGYKIVFLNALSEPFSITGADRDRLKSGELYRLPENCDVNGGALWLSKKAAGIKVRFATNSPYIGIYTELLDVCHMAHMPLSGSCGFDLYRLENGKERFIKAFMPPTGVCSGIDHYHSISAIAEDFTDIYTYTLYLPLYTGVKKLEIGVAPDAVLEKGADYIIDKPVIYYGSSITQGGCASRPGNSYPSLISHMLNVDHTNLGFSGCCIGELAMAEYIGGLSLCAFVYDYDYNAPTPQYLRETHEAFFKRIRALAPALPVIILSAPCDAKDGDDRERRDIIKATYENAVSNGDKNVYFIDGGGVFSGPLSDCCTVDGVHPNDLGFYRMAEKLLPVLKTALDI